jgi:hypothetical protein
MGVAKWTVVKCSCGTPAPLDDRIITMPDFDIDQLRVDRTAFKVMSLYDPPEDWRYWLGRPSGERFAALEINRRVVYGNARCAGRLQRVLEITQRPTR